MKDRLHAWQRQLTARIGGDISTPEARRAAQVHYTWVDHGFLRLWWRNFYQVAPGVYRSNQPSAKQLAAVHRKVGLKTVLNLRGSTKQSFYLFESEACTALGLTLVDLPLSASKAPTVADIEELYRLFQTMQKPFLIHCKSGADRTGFASALYLLLMEGRPIEEAQRQLSFAYLHVKRSPAGIQDHVLRLYAKAFRATGVGFMDWVRQDYDPEAATASFARWRAGDRSLSP